jgi:6-phosphofructokinase 1
MRIGVLTGGGDCPGLNAVIRGIVIQGEREGYEIVGFTEGWLGVLENRSRKLSRKDVEDIQSEGGTILYTSRTNPYKESNGSIRVKDTL